MQTMTTGWKPIQEEEQLLRIAFWTEEGFFATVASCWTNCGINPLGGRIHGRGVRTLQMDSRSLHAGPSHNRIRRNSWTPGIRITPFELLALVALRSGQ